MWTRQSFSLWFMLLLSSGFALGQNTTIDDSDPSILYSPQGGWTARSATENCTACTARPNPGQMYDETWHDSTFYPGGDTLPNTPRVATLKFNGTAVYVFCALAESTTSPDGNSDLGFYVDDELQGQFINRAPGFNNNTYDYRVPVFSLSSLSPYVEHELVIQNGVVNGSQSLILLDYIMYSTENATEPSPSFTSSLMLPTVSVSKGRPSTHTRVVVAVAVTVPVGVVFLLLGCLVYLHRRRIRQDQPTEALRESRASPDHSRTSLFTLSSRMIPQKLHLLGRPSIVVPVPEPALASWTIEPVSLPPSHPASGYVNGSGRPVTGSVPSAPTTSSLQGYDYEHGRNVRAQSWNPVLRERSLGSAAEALIFDEASRRVSLPPTSQSSSTSRQDRRYPTSPSSVSTSSYGAVIYVHNLDSS